MEKLTMNSKDILDYKVKKIAELFPEVYDFESNSIDKEKLFEELNNYETDTSKEKYQLNWPGKKEAIRLGNEKTNKTFRLLKNKGKNTGVTQNIYIEGDNLEALKILQESYLNKIKMIYIDPPYNTGNDFVYNDNFVRDENQELIDSGQMSEDGERMISNPESNGKFHSDWLSMMYPRLKLSRNLLKDDGVIFISIGDDELANLRKICDEIFGEKNFVAFLPRISKRGSSMGKFISPSNDYILCYCKNIEKNSGFVFPQTDEYISQFKYEDETGKYKTSGLYQSSLDPLRGCINQRYYIECPDGELVIPPGDVMPSTKEDGAKVIPSTKNDKVWRWANASYLENKDNLVFTKTSNSPLINSDGKQANWNVYAKQYLASEDDSKVVPGSIIDGYLNSDASKELKELNIDFSFPKPTDLIVYLMKISKVKNDDIVLDFFSGSATTAHAVYKMNAIDNGTRKFILIQVAENLTNSSANYSNECNTICDLAELRIKNAIEKIQDETDNKMLDLGLRVFKIDSSNMKDIYYKPSEVSQTNLFDLISNIKEDRTAEDLLFQVILDLGLTLDLKIEEKTILNNKVFYVADNALVACFDNEVNIDIIDEICKRNPLKVVFKDISFKTDKDKINLEERIKKLSPDTEISIL